MRKICLIFCLFFLLAGCSQSTESVTVLQTSVPNMEYPAPFNSLEDTTYPGPAYITPVISENSTLSDTLVIPEPSADSAVVYGQLTAKDAVGQSYLAGDVYLAPIIYSEGEMQFPFVSLDVDRDPKETQRTKDHRFLFVDIPPGVYGIVIHTPVSDYVVLDDIEGFRYIEVSAGDVIDLGIITIE